VLAEVVNLGEHPAQSADNAARTDGAIVRSMGRRTFPWPWLLLSLVGPGSACAPRAPVAATTPVMPDDLSSILAEGAAAPEVEGIGTNEKPQPLRRYRGTHLVLYFYPMDFAAGATAEAAEFRSDHLKYRRLGAEVVGVSTDAPQSHRDFRDKHRLPFPLLSDPDGRMARAFGVPMQAGTIGHATFLIDRRGVIRKVWPKVHPWGHSRQVLAALKALPRQ
jgi:thioredoxin-dependent peroxiredoxin